MHAFGKKCFWFNSICFSVCKLLKSCRNVYRESSAKRECHDENVFLKANRTLSKLNFLFHLKLKTYWVRLRKCNWHLQYYEIDLSFSIKLQEIKLNVCEEYKTEREARGSNNGAWSATFKYFEAQCAIIESCTLGALKFTSEACNKNVPRSGQIFLSFKETVF